MVMKDRTQRYDRIARLIGRRTDMRGVVGYVVKFRTSDLRRALKDPRFDRKDRGLIWSWLDYRLTRGRR